MRSIRKPGTFHTEEHSPSTSSCGGQSLTAQLAVNKRIQLSKLCIGYILLSRIGPIRPSQTPTGPSHHTLTLALTRPCSNSLKYKTKSLDA
ncbi:hypothetical protein AG1IA_02638 [Rhizoctonia solani AG-1 IA]|uniref:Uncharacterized protein n=1 Tax=Thanatephorus cucumeris (strain AG1-IA) TaxID=983506 RepID=L8WZC9_THACA|nr:hypothetical protein AG1IA_02638 [Rhizoctonia solani AG-1 IA]